MYIHKKSDGLLTSPICCVEMFSGCPKESLYFREDRIHILSLRLGSLGFLKLRKQITQNLQEVLETL